LEDVVEVLNLIEILLPSLVKVDGLIEQENHLDNQADLARDNLSQFLIIEDIIVSAYSIDIYNESSDEYNQKNQLNNEEHLGKLLPLKSNYCLD
jgi:hypothetical protein